MGGIYIPPLTRRSIRAAERILVIACPIALAHFPSSELRFTSAIQSLSFTTLSSIVQQSHIDSSYFARFNASHNGHFKPLSELAHEHFSTLCDQNFLALHELLHALHEPSQSLHGCLWSHQVYFK